MHSDRRPALALTALAMIAALGAVAVPAAGAPAAPPAPAASAHPWWAGWLLSATRVAPGKALPKGTTMHRIRYLSSTPAGKPTVVSGLTLTPPGRAPSGGRPVISWAHGTTGIGDRCAPSVDKTFAGYGKQFREYLRAGYAITATDYPGLGTPGTHPYLIAESQARSVIDAVPAAQALDPAFGPRWFAVGHSQGGQATMATAEIADEYSPGPGFRGAVGYAPAPNLADEPAEELDPLSQTFYVMALVGLKTQYPRLRYADYLGPRARALLPAVHSQCIDDLAATFVRANVAPDQFEPRNAAAERRLRVWFAAGEIGNRRADGPLFVAQGSADVVVLPRFTDAFVADARAQGSTVRYRSYRGADHGTVLDAAARDVLGWLARHR